MTTTFKSLIAASLFAIAAAPAFAAGASMQSNQGQAWEKVESANTANADEGNSGPGLVFQSEVDQYARELAAGKAAPDAGRASNRPVSPKTPMIIQPDENSYGG